MGAVDLALGWGAGVFVCVVLATGYDADWGWDVVLTDVYDEWCLELLWNPREVNFAFYFMIMF